MIKKLMVLFSALIITFSSAKISTEKAPVDKPGMGIDCNLDYDVI